MTELRNWVCFNYWNMLDVPVNLQLAGCIYGDSRFVDGDYVITSRVISVNGRSIVTQSGTHYWLAGNPDDLWTKWCEEKGIEMDPDDPFASIQIQLTTEYP